MPSVETKTSRAANAPIRPTPSCQSKPSGAIKGSIALAEAPAVALLDEACPPPRPRMLQAPESGGADAVAGAVTHVGCARGLTALVAVGSEREQHPERDGAGQDHRAGLFEEELGALEHELQREPQVRDPVRRKLEDQRDAPALHHGSAEQRLPRPA